MAVNISLYSFSKKRNSTAVPTGEGTALACKLKTGVSVLSPVIEINATAGFNPITFTYARIPDFFRWYYITDWQYLNGIWVASLDVDVLASFKDEIGASTQYIARASSAYNGSIIDTIYPADTQTTITTTTAESRWQTSLTTGFYVVGIIGAGVTYHLFSPDAFHSFCTSIFQSSTIYGEIQKELFNPFQYIASVKWFPITPAIAPEGTVSTSIKLGWWDFPASSKILSNNFVCTWTNTITIPQHPQASDRGNFCNVAPYAKLTLEYQPFGTFPLDTTVYANYSSLYSVVKVDLMSGIGTLWISPTNSQADATSIAVSPVGINIQISQLNTHPVSTAVNLMSAATSAGIALGGASLGAPRQALTGGVGAVAGIANAVMSAMPSVQTSGSNGAFSIYAEPMRLVGIFHHIVNDDVDNRGRPLCQDKQINTLTGFIQCDDVHLNISGYPAELSEIVSYLISGFYYE